MSDSPPLYDNTKVCVIKNSFVAPTPPSKKPTRRFNDSPSISSSSRTVLAPGGVFDFACAVCLSVFHCGHRRRRPDREGDAKSVRPRYSSYTSFTTVKRAIGTLKLRGLRSRVLCVSVQSDVFAQLVPRRIYTHCKATVAAYGSLWLTAAARIRTNQRRDVSIFYWTILLTVPRRTLQPFSKQKSDSARFEFTVADHYLGFCCSLAGSAYLF
ncbi:uncharacterized protein V6R79_011621 [Siganus canaliculatus]